MAKKIKNTKNGRQLRVTDGLKPNPVYQKYECTWTISKKAKADLFVKHQEKTFQPLPRQAENKDITEIIKWEDIVIQQVLFNVPLSKIKNSLNAKQASWYNLLANKYKKTA